MDDSPADLDPLLALSGADAAKYLTIALALVAINAFFVAAEYSIVAVRRSRVHHLVESGSAPAIVVQRLQRQIDRFLSATQLGITLSSIGLGWLGKEASALMAAKWLGYLPLPPALQATLAESFSVPLAFLLVVYVQIVLGELVPKSIALMNAERVALWVGRPSETLMNAFAPFLWGLNQSTKLLLRLLGLQYAPASWYSAVSVEELQSIVTNTAESSGLEVEERELLKNVFEFGEATAGYVMVPRTNIRYIGCEDTVRDLLVLVEDAGYSCYPVVGESLDDIRGIVHIKEVIPKLAADPNLLDRPLSGFLRPVRFIAENTYLAELLPRMQRSRQSMVMVYDEFGGTAGLVTLQDIIAEIVGDGGEPQFNPDPDIFSPDGQTFLVQGQVSVYEVNQVLDLDLPITDDYQTIAGFAIYQLQRIPMAGETFTYNDLEFWIEEVDGPRIERLRLQRRHAANPVAGDRPEDAAPSAPSSLG